MSVHGQRTTAGSAVQIIDNSDLTLRKVTIKAATGNTGDMTVGTKSSLSATNGYVLDAAEAIELDISNVKEVWLFGAASHTASFIAVG